MDLPISPASEERNWAELPWDALSVVYEKIGAVGIILSAQAVCRPWRKLAFDHRVWRRVRFVPYWGPLIELDFDSEKMAADVVKRSGHGNLVELSIMNVATDEVLQLLSERARELKILRIGTSYRISDEAFSETIKNLSSLEELEISYHPLEAKTVELIGHSCRKLKFFRMNGDGIRIPYIPYNEYNEEAFAIAKSMTGVRELQIFGNTLDNVGLHALLDGCANLQLLDLRHCFHLDFDEDLKKKCKGLKIRYPKDSTDGYPYSTGCGSEYDIDNVYDDDDYDDYNIYDYEDYDDFTRPELYETDFMLANLSSDDMAFDDYDQY